VNKGGGGGGEGERDAITFRDCGGMNNCYKAVLQHLLPPPKDRREKADGTKLTRRAYGEVNVGWGGLGPR